MQRKQRRQPMRLNSCGGRQVFQRGPLPSGSHRERIIVNDKGRYHTQKQRTGNESECKFPNYLAPFFPRYLA
jgi:hypothetical protein